MEAFPISPASAKPLWFVAVVCVVLAVVFVALAWTAYSARHSRVEIQGDHLRLVGDFWGRRIPFSLLDMSRIRIVDLNRTPEYYPKRRTLGTGLPGYASGWFRLRGGEKALVYLTNRQHVVYMPTSDGDGLLLSIEEAERFVAALRQRVPGNTLLGVLPKRVHHG